MAKKEATALTEYLLAGQAGFYRMAYGCLRDRDDALDAVQTAVCRALEKEAGLKDPAAVRTWFYRILTNACMDVLRGRKRVILVPPEALDEGAYDDLLPEESLSRRVDALPPEVGQIIRLRFYEEFTLQEIAEITGWNLSTVKTRLYGGLKKLRVSLEGEAQ
jgi:RNA polymerase sigma-70 factor (ECF subfamily)